MIEDNNLRDIVNLHEIKPQKMGINWDIVHYEILEIEDNGILYKIGDLVENYENEIEVYKNKKIDFS